MRILVVQESDWFEKGPHQSHHLMERLSLRGHEIRVIDFEILWRLRKTRGIYSSRTSFEGVHRATENGKVDVVRPSIIRFALFDYLSVILFHSKEIWKQMREFKPDIVVGFGILNAGIALRAARKTGVPFVYYLIDELHRLVPHRVFQGVARVIESSNTCRADLIISINEGLREYTIRMGAPRLKTEVLGAGIDLASYVRDRGDRNLRKRLGILDDDLLLFYMGWLYDFSGLREVIDGLSLQSEIERRRIKLLIVGKGEQEPLLQKTVEEHGLNRNVIMTGWRPYSEIPEYLLSSDICILPALPDPVMQNIVPIKMYEYMAAGKPVISTKLPGVVLEFGFDNGIVYVDRAEEVAAKALEMTARAETLLLGQRARNFVGNRDWEHITQRFERILMETARRGQNAIET